jgi:hypothetical protein
VQPTHRHAHRRPTQGARRPAALIATWTARRIGATGRSGRAEQTRVPLDWTPTAAGSQRSLVPDVVIERDDLVLVLDAKYKQHASDIERLGWTGVTEQLREQHRADLLQALAYSTLFGDAKSSIDGHVRLGVHGRRHMGFEPTRAGATPGMLHNGPDLRAARARRLLPYTHTHRILNCMKTTLVIDDTVMRRLRAEAARRGVTMSELAEAGIRRVLDEPTPQPDSLSQLPHWDSGGARVDVADRDVLYALLDRD